MKKLSMHDIHKKLLAEAEMKKVSYQKAKTPDGKSREVGKPKDLSSKKSTITQITTPSKEKPTSKSGGMNLPAASRGDIVPDPANTFKKTSRAKSMATPKVDRLTPNQTQKQKTVTPRKGTASSGGKTMIPQAKDAETTVNQVSRGNITAHDGGTPTVKKQSAAKLNATTRPSAKQVTPRDPSKNKKQVTQIAASKGSRSTPSDAPSKPTWQKVKSSSHNVMESVTVVLNGQPKASYGVIREDVAKKLVENYKHLGFEAKLVRGKTPAAWKQDREFARKVMESIDAQYNGAPTSARRARKEAMNKFFELSQRDYTKMYESKQDFAQTLRRAFDKIMERADARYRSKLVVFDGTVRVLTEGEVHDVEVISQARDTQMALRQMQAEIIEDYGFDAKIKHIFVEGKKYLPKDIEDWGSADSKKNR